MPFPVPVPGLVIRYRYLWASEHARGLEEGLKDRPCAVILVTENDAGDQVVTVLPVSHSLPADPALAVEIPLATKRRLQTTIAPGSYSPKRTDLSGRGPT